MMFIAFLFLLILLFVANFLSDWATSILYALIIVGIVTIGIVALIMSLTKLTAKKTQESATIVTSSIVLYFTCLYGGRVELKRPAGLQSRVKTLNSVIIPFCIFVFLVLMMPAVAIKPPSSLIEYKQSGIFQKPWSKQYLKVAKNIFLFLFLVVKKQQFKELAKNNLPEPADRESGVYLFLLMLVLLTLAWRQLYFSTRWLITNIQDVKALRRLNGELTIALKANIPSYFELLLW